MNSLRIYNTLARDKQPFTPLRPGEVRMYVCGMTVYDYCHVGHARVMVVFDLVQRWLRTLGYKVTHVQNITDIDDKIIRRAVENNEPIKSLTQRFITAMHEDADALGVARPDLEPRATDFIPQMLGMIDALEANGYAYHAKDGDVNYAVRKFAGYGKLSGKSLEDLRAGSASRPTTRRKIRSTSCCGSARRRASPRTRAGTRSGDAAVRAGISNVRPWPANCSANISTFTAAVRTCSSRITRTRSRKAKARPARSS